MSEDITPISPAGDDRLAALLRTGLSATPDPAFDRFADMVRKILKVPVALVTLVEHDRQIFPGSLGLPAPWQDRRQTPMSHSFCQLVVRSGAPLVIEDARLDERVAGNLAITELGVVGYAGMPLTDSAGRLLGSLCAIDTAPRRWTEPELSLLADLAAACSDSLRLRIATTTARRNAELIRQRTSAAYERSQLLLRASVTLAGTTTVDDVVDAVRELATGILDPAYVGVSLLDAGGRVTLRSGRLLPARVADRWGRYPSSARTPSALATRLGAPVLLPDLAAVAALTPDVSGTFAEMGWQAGAAVPLPGPRGAVGAITFVWKEPYELDAAEQTVLAALAGYVSQALHRADYLYSRENVAAVLQQAMLTDLPDAAPYELAARYAPAVRGEQVGGDWYDAVRVDGDHLAVAIGDVTGHDMRAAARMGQLRSMLRLLVIDRHEPPSALLRRLDTANHLLGERTTATAVLAYLQPEADRGGHRLHWSNAGHPSPMLVHADGTTPLTGNDPILGLGRRTPRTNHYRNLPPGSTVLFYTDGLLETRVDDLEEREVRLQDALTELAGAPLPELLGEVLTEFAGDDHEDDVALLAVRTPQ